MKKKCFDFSEFEEEDCSPVLSGYVLVPPPIGFGGSGIIFKVKDTKTNEYLALKTQIFTDDAEDERLIGCELSKLHDKTQSFIQFRNWFECPIPEKWIPNGLKSSSMWKERLLTIEMTLADGSFFSIIDSTMDITEIQFLSSLFEVLNAFYWSRKEYKFTHNDFHDGNLLYIINAKPRTYKINGTIYEIKNEYLPVIADFGSSKINEKTTTNDMSNLRAIFLNLLNNVTSGIKFENDISEFLLNLMNKDKGSADYKIIEDALKFNIFDRLKKK